MLTAALLSAAIAAREFAFERLRIGDTTYEACSAFDVNNDGALDIVTGEYWYEGPGFTAKHRICTLRREQDYFDDFADFPMDVNGDGYLDIVTGAWWGQAVLWRENPRGLKVEWKVHAIAQVGNVERPCFWDVDGDGHLDIAPNTPGNPQRLFKLVRDAAGKGTAQFIAHTISDHPSAHGLGFGDINGDGRGDLVQRFGWFEAPEKPFEQPWTLHREFELPESASVPILVHDVNSDGLNDLIVGAGHDYGLFWYEQRRDADGARSWARHVIDMENSQYHEMALADLDGDGAPELITGKRWRAHASGDPGVDDPVGLYVFRIAGGKFERTVLNRGDASNTSGTGIYLWIHDIDGDDRLDILAPGKEGLYLFLNRTR